MSEAAAPDAVWMDSSDVLFFSPRLFGASQITVTGPRRFVHLDAAGANTSQTFLRGEQLEAQSATSLRQSGKTVSLPHFQGSLLAGACT